MIRIGPAGWAYKDWSGVVYPRSRPRGFHELTFLAQFFDAVEINVSFYRPISVNTSSTWLSKIERNPNFRFTAKLWRGFTHERTATVADEKEFKQGLEPLLHAGRFGALLLQFPWSFRNTEDNRVYLTKLARQFAEFPLVLEVRHSSWAEPGTLDRLEQMELGLCNIDQPLFTRSIEPSALATSTVGYVRLHGRNYKSWFTENKFPGERYDYLYSLPELDPWIDRIKTVEHGAKDVYVVTNNHFLGKAVVNALEISSILKAEPVSAPSSLLKRYPELNNFASSCDEPSQLSFQPE